MSKHKVGDTAIFKEHIVQVKDLDSLMTEGVKVLVKDDEENYEDAAVEYAKKVCSLAMAGNTLEGEYIGATGKSIHAEYKVLKTGWVKGAEATPDDGSLNVLEYFKID